MEVEVETLDNISESLSLVSPVLLKLDVQGFEKEVLRGGEGLLKQIDFLLFETSFIQMYENEPLFEEMHEFVSHLGFKILAPIGLLRSKDQRIVQMDMLYKRKS